MIKTRVDPFFAPPAKALPEDEVVAMLPAASTSYSGPASVPPKQWGITPPISSAGPTPKEVEITRLLIEELHKQGCYESKEEGKLRWVALGSCKSKALAACD